MKAYARRKAKDEEQRLRLFAPKVQSQAPAATQMASPRFAHQFGSMPVQARQAGAPAIQRQPSPNVTASDEWEQYEKAQEEIAQFQAGAPYFRFNHQVANGLFDAIYLPPNFNILVRMAFHFYPMESEVEKGSDEPRWTQKEADEWKARYLAEVSKKWTDEKFVLFCTEPRWETLTAQVVVRMLDVNSVRQAMPFIDASSIPAHWLLNIKKVRPGGQSPGVTYTPGGTPPHGDMNLDSQALEPLTKKGGNRQRTAIHESGHVFGLADLYADDDNPAMQAEFQKRAKQELSVDVPVGNDSRLMSLGEKMGPPDAISFVEAIRAATGKKWSLFPGKQRPVPHRPEDLNDLVRPRETVV